MLIDLEVHVRPGVHTAHDTSAHPQDTEKKHLNRLDSDCVECDLLCRRRILYAAISSANGELAGLYAACFDETPRLR